MQCSVSLDILSTAAQLYEKLFEKEYNRWMMLMLIVTISSLEMVHLIIPDIIYYSSMQLKLEKFLKTFSNRFFTECQFHVPRKCRFSKLRLD